MCYAAAKGIRERHFPGPDLAAQLRGPHGHGHGSEALHSHAAEEGSDLSLDPSSAGAAFYDSVCRGQADPQTLRVAASGGGEQAAGMRVVLATDRFLKNVSGAWLDTSFVDHLAMVKDEGGQNMFQTGLGHALYDSAFRGGRSARYESLAREVQPVLADMLLMVTADGGFWPTPGSTMSQVKK